MTMDDIVAAEAHDAAMDSLARSQRNELLGDVSRKRAEARAYKARVTEDPQSEIERGFWRTLLRATLIATGWMIEVFGQIHVVFGRAIRELGEKL